LLTNICIVVSLENSSSVTLLHYSRTTDVSFTPYEWYIASQFRIVLSLMEDSENLENLVRCARI